MRSTLVRLKGEKAGGNKWVAWACVAVAVLLPLRGSADQLSKRGSYSGVYAWYVATGETVQADKDHAIWGGASTGAFRNDAGGGFLHAAVVVCTFSGEFKKDAVTHNNGDCVATDKDGDKVAAVWKCTACPGVGEFQWTSGTGKYAGIKGRNSFQQTDAGPPGARVGWSVWKGEWELP